MIYHIYHELQCEMNLFIYHELQCIMNLFLSVQSKLVNYSVSNRVHERGGKSLTMLHPFRQN